MEVGGVEVVIEEERLKRTDTGWLKWRREQEKNSEKVRVGVKEGD